MKNMFITAMCICLMTLAGCNKASADTDAVNPKARAALIQKYPEATDVKWVSKNGYIIAKFNAPATRSSIRGYDFSVWFSSAGQWCMTESETVFDALPEAVKTAFMSSTYSDWRIDDIDRLERAGMETFYVIEVEQRSGNISREADLYYSETGILIKTVLDEDEDYDYEDYLPSDIRTDITGLIGKMYPGATIVDIEYEDAGIEAEIIHDGRGKDVYLAMNLSWIRTEWDVRRSELPEAVTGKIAANWPGWKIDDSGYVETPSSAWYEIELEKGDSEIDIRIAPDGTVLQ